MKSLEKILEEITPIEQAQTDARMQIAYLIANAMKDKGWKAKDLMQALGRNTPSLVTKWLSGTHNFTVDTLVELEEVLNIEILALDNEKIDKSSNYNWKAVMSIKPIQNAARHSFIPHKEMVKIDSSSACMSAS